MDNIILLEYVCQIVALVLFYLFAFYLCILGALKQSIRPNVFYFIIHTFLSCVQFTIHTCTCKQLHVKEEKRPSLPIIYLIIICLFIINTNMKCM